MDPATPLRWLDRQAPCTGWGPGARAVIWLPAQTQLASAQAGTAGELVEWVCMHAGIDGVTFTGTEPLVQSRGIVNLIQLLKDQQPLMSFICHTQFPLAALQRENHAWRRVLLEIIDVLAHGPGQEPRDSYWGSLAGQQLAALGKYYRELIPSN
jgi:hypothetical protein